MAEKIGIQVKDGSCLTVEEASHYFGIGEKKLRRSANDDLNAGFVIRNSMKILIKRQRFEGSLNELSSIQPLYPIQTLKQLVQINMEIEPWLWYNLSISCRGSFHGKERSVSEKRRDSKNRILRSGESRRKDGRYSHKYVEPRKTASRRWRFTENITSSTSARSTAASTKVQMPKRS